ncbi:MULTISPECIES: hypothetical protein [unclassified Bradyrhizobium]|uniref:hypothetical protein n=1 Tax=unclassified Bradyrhizobium TaxID=2631580 RepID=UPI002916423A|nr:MULTISPECIES: hypothetical protein [unclassified Bradyrhizobium]
MFYMVTAERISGDERSRERFLVDATNDHKARDKASADSKGLGALSIVVDLRMGPSCTSSNALASPANFAHSDGRIGEPTRSSDFHSAVRALCLVSLATIGCLALAPVQAQRAGGASDDVQKGHYLAVLMCSNCHVVSSAQAIEPTLQPPAPPFESIARRSSTSSETLGAFLSTTHRNIGNSTGMPNPDLRDFQMRQVGAYVLSLRTSSDAAPMSRKPPATRPELCRDEIARVELLMSKARASGQALVSAPESSAARLHRQPTLKSVEQATSEAKQNVETAVAFARELEAEGLYAECTAMLQKIQPPSGSPN